MHLKYALMMSWPKMHQNEKSWQKISQNRSKNCQSSKYRYLDNRYSDIESFQALLYSNVNLKSFQVPSNIKRLDIICFYQIAGRRPFLSGMDFRCWNWKKNNLIQTPKKPVPYSVPVFRVGTAPIVERYVFTCVLDSKFALIAWTWICQHFVPSGLNSGLN